VLAGLGGRIVQGVKRADRKLLDATGLLGFQVAMDLGWIQTFGSLSNPTAQLSVVRQDASAPVIPQLTVDVADVDAVHAQALRRGLESWIR
jgi:hypothetical protein